jgi:hypothetical protein
MTLKAAGNTVGLQLKQREHDVFSKISAMANTGH